jgi:hypothetical protein
MMQGDPERPNSPTSPLEYYDRDDAPLDDGPPDGPPGGNDPDDGPPGGDGNPGEDPDYDPDDHPTPPGSPPGTPDMAGQFLGAIQSLATNLISMQRPAATPRPEKVKVREPEPFDGSDPRKLRSFLVSCNLHFRDRPYAFPNDEKKILFVLSYLNGSAISWFEPGLMDPTNSAHWMWDFEVFLNELEVNFGPHDPVGDAEKSLTEISMKDSSRIVKYNVEFWKLVARVDWNESALTARYFCGLPLRLRVEVMRGGKPTSLATMRLKAQDADDIYWMQKDEANQETRNSGNSGNSAKEDSKGNTHSNSNFNSNHPSPKPTSSNVGNPASSGKRSEPKDKPKPNPLADKLGKNGKLTGEEQERRMKEGLCLYCGKSGHVAHDCPKAVAAKARAASVESKDSADSKK